MKKIANKNKVLIFTFSAIIMAILAIMCYGNINLDSKVADENLDRGKSVASVVRLATNTLVYSTSGIQGNTFIAHATGTKYLYDGNNSLKWSGAAYATFGRFWTPTNKWVLDIPSWGTCNGTACGVTITFQKIGSGRPGDNLEFAFSSITGDPFDLYLENSSQTRITLNFYNTSTKAPITINTTYDHMFFGAMGLSHEARNGGVEYIAATFDGPIYTPLAPEHVLTGNINGQNWYSHKIDWCNAEYLIDFKGRSDISIIVGYTTPTDPTMHFQIGFMTYGIAQVASHDLTYVPNGGTIKETGYRTTFDADTPTFNLVTNVEKEGYVFAGWYEKSDLTGTPITNIPKGTDEDVTVYAKWLPKIGDIKLTKKDQYNDALLGGVKFKLYTNAAATTEAKDADGVLVGEITTNASGYAQITNLNYGDYYLKETSTISGYILKTDITKVTIGVANSGVAIVTITNVPKTGTLQVNKSDSITGQPLVGFKFKLYTDAAGTIEAKKADGTAIELTTNMSGSAQVTGLRYGTYYLKETYALPNYEALTTLIEVNITTDSTPVVKNITNTLKTGIIKITKKDHYNNELLAGVKFKLYIDAAATTEAKKADGSTITITTDENGYAEVSNIYYGTYYLKEIETLSNYILNTTVFEAKIDSDNSGLKELEIKNVPRVGELQINKTDSITNLPLEGFKFKLYTDAAGTIEAKTVTGGAIELTTNASGFAKVENLRYGTYYLKETYAHPDYVALTTLIEVKITSDQEPVIKNIKNTLKTGVINITKKDYYSNDLLAGMKFKLFTDAAATIEAKTDKGASTLVTTDEFGYAQIKDIYYGTYYLKEVETLPSYIINTTIVKVTINSSNSGVKAEEFKNVPRVTELQINKIDSLTNAPMEGIEFRLYTDAAGTIEAKTVTGTAIGIIKTDAAGFAKVENLRYGTYYLKETKTFWNYVLIEDPIRFVLDDDTKPYVLGVKNTLKTGALHLIKKDSKTNTEVGGVKFKLYVDQECTIEAKTSKGKTVEITSKSSGYAEVKDLYYGIYYIKETETLDNYEVLTSIEEIEIKDVTNEITIFNVPIELEVVIKDINTKKELGGGIIKIIDAISETVISEFTSTEAITTLHFSKGRYIIEELVAPYGYAKLMNTIEFTIDEYGKLTLISDEDTSYDISGKLLTIYNDKNVVIISDKDSKTGEDLEGAKLVVVCEDDFVKEWVTLTTPEQFNLNPEKKCTLKQIEAPGDYDRVTTELEFIVLGNGDIQPVGEIPGEYSIIGNKIVVYNGYVIIPDVPDTGIFTWIGTAIGIALIGFGTYIFLSRKKQLV